jgi:ankyrin repeat protein
VTDAAGSSAAAASAVLDDLCSALRRAAEDGCFLDAWNALVNMAHLEEDSEASHIDVPDEHGETALTLAALHGNARILNALLDKGADDQHCPDDATPIPMVRMWYSVLYAGMHVWIDALCRHSVLRDQRS